MKKILLVALTICLTTVNAQINNLNDLLTASELNVQELVAELQYTWDLGTPEQDTSTKGFVTERYVFIYNKEGKKQVLKKCGSMNLETGQTFWLTNFISDDKELLNRITKNLQYNGYEQTMKQGVNTMYEDGNNMISVQTESDENLKLPVGCYAINVILDKKYNFSVVPKQKAEIEKEPKKSAMDNLMAGKSMETEEEYIEPITRTLLNPPTNLIYDCKNHGTVVLMLNIDKNGNVINVKKIGGTNDKCLVQYAIEEAKKLKYTPIDKDIIEETIYKFDFK